MFLSQELKGLINIIETKQKLQYFYTDNCFIILSFHWREMVYRVLSFFFKIYLINIYKIQNMFSNLFIISAEFT